MPTTIRALLVNPTTKTVTPCTFERNSLSQMYDLIGCHTFDAVALVLEAVDGELYPVTLWVDDEGALKDPEEQRCCFIGLPGRVRHLAGNILVTGPSDSEGEITDLLLGITPEIVAEQVVWDAPPVRPWMQVTVIEKQ